VHRVSKIALTASVCVILLSACGAPPPALPTVALTPTPRPTGEGLVSVSLSPVIAGFTSPVALIAPPDGSNFLYVVDQIGVISVFDQDNPGDTLHTFLDIKSKIIDLRPEYDERGLLGLAFDPDFGQDGRFFVMYSAPRRDSAPEDWDHTQRIAEYHVDPQDPRFADPNSERIILDIDHPFESHDGGALAFGPDGYLYVGLGDGGSTGDPMNLTQNLKRLQGKILRIDIHSGDPYSVPPDNPFVGEENVRPEIYAFGFRNPYRFSFDPVTGMLIVGDVGQSVREEINVVEKGQDYGWAIKEGTTCYNLRDQYHPQDVCGDVGSRADPLIPPVIEYPHDPGLAVIGGFIYRGDAIPSLYGRYLFGDWGMPDNGLLMVATPTAEGIWPFEYVTVNGAADGKLGMQLTGIGQDSHREIYLLTKLGLGPTGNSGAVWRVLPAQP